MINNKQKQLINVAKNQLMKMGRLTEENYRDILSGFDVQSIKDENFSDQNARDLLKIFTRLGFKHRVKGKIKRYDNAAGMATLDQKELIKKLWRESEAVRDYSETAMNRFIKRIAFVDDIEWLPENRVHKVIKGIESIKAKPEAEVRNQKSEIRSEK